ncbi:HAD family hydrolase [Alkalicoccus luteus]|uniref:HAD family hydrolase n=1 Tax=Alkalicoccus luteus TaxID=1237094 RepID=A0A969TWJ9_9BACI|nr:HAD family hydrolase [Alkalicoccus luteus]NJP39292.1 HAD family hydrolase [Alkalicoccus luteus]
MRIRAVFLDMDGTLLNNEETISLKMRHVIEELKRAGIYVFLATGRHLDITLPHHRSLGLKTPMICLNGAAVYDWFSLDPLQMKYMHSPWELHEAVVRSGARNIMVHAEEGLYCLEQDEIVQAWVNEGGKYPVYTGPLHTVKPENILKYSVRSADFITLPKKLYSRTADLIRWQDGFELVRKEISKWSAIEYLLYQYGISKEEAIAFGDGPNDIDMLCRAGTGVAMGNAIPELKKAADFVTGTNAEDGAADFLVRHVLQAGTVEAQ